MPDVLIAVVSWNTRDLLDACLRSLRGRRVVVVDNDSSDGSAAMVRERHPWAELIEPGANLGFGRAVNLAARGRDFDWLAIANADVEVEPGALEALLDAGAGDPRAGVLAPRLLLPGGATQHSVHPFPTLPTTLAFNLGLPAVIPGLGDRLCLEGRWDPERSRRVPWAIGAFWLVRGAAWRAAGGFDERQFMYAEDLDLGWRLARAGWATRYVPGARVRHADAAATARAWGEARVERWQRATYLWMLRRRGAPLTRAVAAVNVTGAGARWLALAALARRDPARHAWRRDLWRTWARRHRCGLRPGDHLAD